MLTPGKLSDVERDALAGILGRRRSTGTSMRIAIADLDAALYNGGLAESLRDALEKRPALFLNLPVQNQLAGSGEPGYLSLRALLRAPPLWDVARRAIFVCENPNLIAIVSDTLGVNCAPLACADCMPAAAQRTLLMQLSAAGARLHYHGDVDWSGIGIGNLVMQQFGALAWRFRTEDDRAATAVAAAD